jgi:predicted small secreted protein
MMNKHTYTLVLILSTFLLTSCATTQDISNDVRTKVFQEGYNEVFKTTVQTLSDGGYVISDADQETGLINTDYSQASEWEAFWTGDERTKVNALLSEQNGGTQIRLTVSVQSKDFLTGWQSANMTKSKAEEYYEKLFSEISSNL